MTKQKLKHDNCDGCTIKYDDSTCAGENEDASCPCTKCIVKVTCVVYQSECDLYNEWWNRRKPNEK